MPSDFRHFHHSIGMSGPPRGSKSSPPSADAPTRTPLEEGKQWEYKDCISCRVVGTGALGLTGLYALHMSRPKAPGSVFGKMMMAGIGVGESPYFRVPFLSMERPYVSRYTDNMYAGFLAGSVVRWNMTPTEMLGTFTDQFRGAPPQPGS